MKQLNSDLEYRYIQINNMLDEADIGSGEKTPGELETERLVQQLSEPQESEQDDPDKGNLNKRQGDRRATIDEEIDAPHVRKREQQESFSKDDSDSQLDQVDPVPPWGD